MKEEKELFSHFEELFWQVTRSMGKVWREIFDEHFPGSQSHLVFMLERRGRLRMSELAEALQLTAGAVTSASDKLIEHGYVSRTRDEKDRRVVYLDITEKGCDTMQELRMKGRKKMKSVFAHMSEEDLQRCIQIFEQATDVLTTGRKDSDV
ncbi:MarR family transcriptional regulator [Sporosarcina sp. PTS2304]|uniref:MarR family winged helix-turn-helix transcriptional regulator n=1 Tax=Sporosarcina sp. PTS2304 TaxID=2283194 RepID=UPI000E0D5D86|nr:MarR family transcriptional regulator [Sporosarcina sp. PTS2304]AXI00587.1 MarR family transcriptional regulator [Sporosarcina sp. PTS2304]